MSDTDICLTDTRLIKQASRAEDEPFERGTLAEFEVRCVLPFHPRRDRLPDPLRRLDVGLVLEETWTIACGVSHNCYYLVKFGKNGTGPPAHRTEWRHRRVIDGCYSHNVLG